MIAEKEEQQTRHHAHGVGQKDARENPGESARPPGPTDHFWPVPDFTSPL